MLDKPSFSQATRRTEPPTTGLWSGGPEIVLDVAFLNNMPDAAFEATERQFTRLIRRGAAPAKLRMHRFMFPEKKSKSGLPEFDLERYESTEALGDVRVDALVVTGSEPMRPDLRDEDYWGSMRRLVAWARTRSISSLWSCLAAHAAVLELDGVERKALRTKRSGVFECQIVSDHPLVRGFDAPAFVPHSRWNEIRENDLVSRGYEILTRSTEAGADAFAKKSGGLFLFLQGHPEYDTRSLMFEFRRDLKRYVDGDRLSPPTAPLNYFAPDTQNLLERVAQEKSETLRLAAAYEALRAEWRMKPALWSAWSATLFQNWLGYVAAEKSCFIDVAAPSRPAAQRSTSLRTES